MSKGHSLFPALSNSWVCGCSHSGIAVTIPKGGLGISLLRMLGVVSYRSLRWAYHQSTGFLPTVVCLERNLETSTSRGADKSLAQTGRKRARKHVRGARDFNNVETRAVIKFLFLQGKAPKEISRHSDINISLFPSW